MDEKTPKASQNGGHPHRHDDGANRRREIKIKSPPCSSEILEQYQYITVPYGCGNAKCPDMFQNSLKLVDDR
ncbi:hypothetical protein F2P81_024475 [Scophthalmus maximus]|uniref:Uncharacterized protein n=1 Tax=Scophthalmus maximus TaxID=52904 RepID=A0A6A4RUD1_SCOMX|nr:hypothetical protein F2P81_024475 [Scophthalmus maximus]